MNNVDKFAQYFSTFNSRKLKRIYKKCNLEVRTLIGQKPVNIEEYRRISTSVKAIEKVLKYRNHCENVERHV